MSSDDKIFKPYSGEFILEHLQRFGSDINQGHEFTFWLYFPTEELAQQAGQRAEEAGFKADILPPLEKFPNSGWLCLLFLPHVPDEKLLDGITEFCLKLAKDFNGKYDGWETKMELPERSLPDLPEFTEPGRV